MILPVKELKKALDIVGLVAVPSHIMPACECVKIEVDEEKATLVATDLRNTVCQVFEHGISGQKSETILPVHKHLHDYVKLLNEPFIELVPEEKEVAGLNKPISIHINSGRSKATIEGDDPGDLPVSELGELRHEICLPFSIIDEIVKKSLPFCSTDELRPAMQGIRLNVDEGHATVLSCNGHVLSKLSRRVPKGNPFKSTISKSIDLIAKIFHGQDEVVLKKSSNKFRVESPTGFMQGVLIEEEFPDLSSELEKYEKGECAIVDRLSLMAEIRKANLFALKENKEVYLGLSGDILKIVSKNDLYGKFYENDIPCDGGSNIFIHIDGNYLQKALAACEGECVKLECFNKTASPLKVTDVENGYSILISPIMPSFTVNADQNMAVEK